MFHGQGALKAPEHSFVEDIWHNGARNAEELRLLDKEHAGFTECAAQCLDLRD
jgi:hypothetical protein